MSKTPPDFELEPSVPEAGVPEPVLDELVNAKTVAKDYAQAFADACKAQAEKYGVKISALKRYVTAREADHLEEAAAEAADVLKLIG